MNDFKKLINVAAQNHSAIIDYDNPLVKAILNNTNNESDNPIMHHAIEKDDYGFNLFMVHKSMPIKNQHSEFKLDYFIKRYYYVEIAINDENDYCKIVLNKFDKKSDANDLYNQWKDLITNNKSNVILREVMKLKGI